MECNCWRNLIQFVFVFFWLSRELLQLFIAAELIHWGTLCQQYEQVLRVGDASTPATNVFTVGEFQLTIHFLTNGVEY
jgi:hypothetical protein